MGRLSGAPAARPPARAAGILAFPGLREYVYGAYHRISGCRAIGTGGRPMARITVEDCVVKVPNRFDLVVMAAQRSRQISAGEPLTIDRDNDKNPVIALRELADSTIDREELRESVIRGLQRHVEMDEPEDDEMELLMARQALAAGDRDEAEMDRVKQEVAEEMETLQATVDHDRGQPADAVDEAGSGAGLAAD